MSIPIPYTSAKQTDDFGLTVSNLIFGSALSSTTNTPLIIPGSAPRFKAVIKVDNPSDVPVVVSLNVAAAIPVGGTFGATTSELVPDSGVMCREVKGGDVLNFFAGGASVVITVSLYSVQGTA